MRNASETRPFVRRSRLLRMTTLLPMPRWRNPDTVLPATTSGEPRALNDAYGRVATDLRVSLTDRRNLRCTYCMPAEGLDWLPAAEVLNDAEIIRLVGIAVTRFGVTNIRF